MSTPARVLVTGAGGHLGGRAAQLLAASGKEVYGTTRKGSASTADRHPGVRWLACDLRKRDEVRAAVEVSRPGLVLHAVGLADGSDLSALIDANVMALANLIEALKGVPIQRILVIGSAAEYAASDKSEPTAEDHPLSPSNRYGLSKLYQFELSQMALRAGMPVVYARPFNLIGPGVSGATAVGDISKRLAAAIKGPRPAVLEVGDLDRWRDYVDARDAAEACRLLLESAAPGDIYNICSGVPVLLADVVKLLVSISGQDVRLRRVEGTPSTRYQVGDSSRLRSLGWSPKTTLETSLRDGLAGYVDSGGAC